MASFDHSKYVEILQLCPASILRKRRNARRENMQSFDTTCCTAQQASTRHVEHNGKDRAFVILLENSLLYCWRWQEEAALSKSGWLSAGARMAIGRGSENKQRVVLCYGSSQLRRVGVIHFYERPRDNKMCAGYLDVMQEYSAVPGCALMHGEIT
ncbi:hypothetical protein Efla_007211 [Eimeria flavescens]